MRAERADGLEKEVETGDGGVDYGVEGEVKVGDVQVAAKTAALIVPGALRVRAETRARYVLLTGAQHRQPIRHRGPYVD